jgi:hypothetical protein
MADNIDVIEVDSRSLLDKFIKFPFKLYKNEVNWVPPLLVERKEFFDKNKNPFFRGAKTKLFLARRDNEIVGRIATCVNFHHNDFHEENVGFFGFFDCIEDYDVAAKLLKVAMITLKSEGVERMRGPASFSTNQEIGFLIEGYEHPPTVMNPFNYPYIPRFAEKFGLKKVMDLHGYLITKETPINERHMRIVERIKQRSKISLRSLDFSKFNDEIKILQRVYNQAWEKNWGFVPMPEEEFLHTAKNLKDIADEDLVLLAEIDGEPAGFSLALPDINQVLIGLNGRLLPFGIIKLLWNTKISNKIDGLRMLTMGVVHKYQKRGIDNLFFVETYNRAVKKGYRWAELSWILETNHLMCSAAEAMGAKLYKKYRMVEMPI